LAARKVAGRTLSPAPASAGGTSFEYAAIGDREPFRTSKPGLAVRRCGAGRDDDVDGAASVCPRRVPRPGHRGTGLRECEPAPSAADRPLQR